MLCRTVLLPLLLVPFLIFQAWADGLQANGKEDSSTAYLGTLTPRTSDNPNLLFRNGLTDVEVQDNAGTPSVQDLVSGTVWGSKAVTLQQKVNDKISLEGQSSMSTTQTSDLPKAAALSGSGTSASSGTTRLAAKWKPLDPVVVSFSTMSESALNRDIKDREAGQSALMQDTQQVKTEWSAFKQTKLSLTYSQEKFLSDVTYDSRTTAMVRFSQGLGKTGLTWNVGRGWRNEKPDNTNPTSVMTGGINETSLDWAPAKTTTLSLGGSWGQMDTASTAARESTRSLFLSWNQNVSKRYQLQLGSTYATKIDAIGGADYWSEDDATLAFGQTLLLSETSSARFDLNHSITRENGIGWKTSESLATFSLRKVF